MRSPPAGGEGVHLRGRPPDGTQLLAFRQHVSFLHTMVAAGCWEKKPKTVGKETGTHDHQTRKRCTFKRILVSRDRLLKPAPPTTT